LLSLWNWRGTIGDNKQKKEKKPHGWNFIARRQFFIDSPTVFVFFSFDEILKWEKRFFSFILIFSGRKEKKNNKPFATYRCNSPAAPTQQNTKSSAPCVCLRENGATTDDDDVQIGARRQQQLTPTTLGREHFRTNIWSFLVWAHARRKRKHFLCCCLPKGKK
jgi:hypothetical protein